MSADDLLPPNATPFERAGSGADRRVLSADVDAIRRARLPAECPSAFVPFLAWERSVHFTDRADEAGNRARTQSSFADHGSYGSPSALEGEIALDVGAPVLVTEFFERSDLDWPFFAVEAVMAPGATPPCDLDALWQSALKRKNVRDMPLIGVRVVQPPAIASVAAATVVSMRMKNVASIPVGPFAGATSRFLPQIKVFPL